MFGSAEGYPARTFAKGGKLPVARPHDKNQAKWNSEDIFGSPGRPPREPSQEASKFQCPARTIKFQRNCIESGAILALPAAKSSRISVAGLRDKNPAEWHSGPIFGFPEGFSKRACGKNSRKIVFLLPQL